jgi:hypothetical protein
VAHQVGDHLDGHPLQLWRDDRISAVALLAARSDGGAGRGRGARPTAPAGAGGRRPTRGEAFSPPLQPPTTMKRRRTRRPPLSRRGPSPPDVTWGRRAAAGGHDARRSGGRGWPCTRTAALRKGHDRSGMPGMALASAGRSWSGGISAADAQPRAIAGERRSASACLGRRHGLPFLGG